MKHSTQIATGGMICALCVLCMFLTGVFPFATYALPAMAGILLSVIVIELSPKWAFVVYIAVSLLSFLLAPDREAALLFFAFFGHYPILKSVFERFPSRVLEYACKFTVFNVCVVGSILVLMYLFQLPNLMDEFGDYGKYGAAFTILAANVVFFVYDIALTRVVTLYVRWFRPKFLRRL